MPWTEEKSLVYYFTIYLRHLTKINQRILLGRLEHRTIREKSEVASIISPKQTAMLVNKW